MKLDISYDKPKKIEYTSGYYIKGPYFRCEYICFKSLYRNPKPGTETMQMYLYRTKGVPRGTVLLVHGLGTSNIKFFQWMGAQLASSGLNCALIILPGNYTRVANGSTSGKLLLYPDIPTLYNAWEHSLVDMQSSIDLLEQMGIWSDNNCSLGYCVGGMLLFMLSAIDNRLKQKIFIATGGSFPHIFHNPSGPNFLGQLFNNGYKDFYHLYDKEYLLDIYNEQLPKIKNMDINNILTADIHPLLRLEPLSYTHLIDKDNVTFIDALMDLALPFKSRTLLYNDMQGSARRIVPSTHVSWLPLYKIISYYIEVKLKLNLSYPGILKNIIGLPEHFKSYWSDKSDSPPHQN